MMRDDVLIRVTGVSKKFAKDLKKSLKYGLADIVGEVLGKQRSQKLRPSEFWAVQDLSFELRRGECLGLIGHNGAGKSTLLKMLNGLIKPDHGQIEMHGRVAALIELGAGFNPILSGRENVYNNASVLGFTKKEVDAKFDEILAFSELGDFIDAPVQSYSSGMKVRLGFSIASQLEPDILLIDEVLAVGDVFFKNKCIARIDELKEKCAVIFVSHSINLIGRICTSALLMERGKYINLSSDIGQIYASYLELAKRNSDIKLDEGRYFKEISIYQNGELKNEINAYSAVDIEIQMRQKMKLRVVFVIFDQSQRPVVSIVGANTIDQDFQIVRIKDVTINLVPGKYSFTINVASFEKNELLEKVAGVAEFTVLGNDFLWSPIVLKEEYDFQ